MVCKILFPVSRPTIKDLEDPIDKAEGFREGLRATHDKDVTLEGLHSAIPHIDEHLERLEGLRENVFEELEHVTTITTIRGKKVDLKRYTAIVDFVGTLVTATLSGGIAFGGRFVPESYNTWVAGASGTVAAIGAQFVKRVKDFQKNAESREALLKMLNSRIDPYVNHLKRVKEKAKENDPVAFLEAARKGTGRTDFMGKFLNEKPTGRKSEIDRLRRRVVTTGDVEAR